jgi:hypothetical protein
VWSKETNFDRVNRITLTKFSWSKFSIKNFGQVLDKTFDRVNGILYKHFSSLQDHVLIELKQTGLKTDKGLVIEDDPFLVVHPNYVIDS